MKTNVLIKEEDIVKRVRELGKEVTEFYKDKNLMVIGILRGGFMFTSDLVKNIDCDVTIEFIASSSYGNAKETSGHLKIHKGIDIDLAGYDVLLVDDIADSGLSLTELVKYVGTKNPRSIKTCTFLDKKEKRKVDLKVDFVGYDIDDYFVVGYGLDYNGLYRNIPYVFTVVEE